ncbi:peroxiredoxin family protein [Salirhabdus sp. Marseille-P4669]|uniref:peroxiredoxin family protein n=1 Tax=Salirhabdus sp. Marseille-P4669 TaxID=2042310 RepID=UPI000C7C730B|nr:TlpA disulfide reductase family protein [Salirhabdus sp. Marseille-P4669]
MKKGIIVVILVAMFGWAIYDLVQKPEEETKSDSFVSQEETETNRSEADEKEMETPNVPVGLEVGNLAPDFELTTLSGETVRLSDYRGKKVMINFWATWCPPCRAEMPDMQEFYEKQDVEILAVNLTQTEANTSDVEAFKEEFGLTFPILLDEDLTVATEYRIRPIPTSYMVDSQGIIQFEALGALNYDLMVAEFEKMQ